MKHRRGPRRGSPTLFDPTLDDLLTSQTGSGSAIVTPAVVGIGLAIAALLALIVFGRAGGGGGSEGVLVQIHGPDVGRLDEGADVVYDARSIGSVHDISHSGGQPVAVLDMHEEEAWRVSDGHQFRIQRLNTGELGVRVLPPPVATPPEVLTGPEAVLIPDAADWGSGWLSESMLLPILAGIGFFAVGVCCLKLAKPILQFALVVLLIGGLLILLSGSKHPPTDGAPSSGPRTEASSAANTPEAGSRDIASHSTTF